MKIEMTPQLRPHRGGEVKIGNVYSTKGQKYYRLVVAIVERQGTRPWNNVICLHIDPTYGIIGSGAHPILYVKEHQDLVGIVKNMPSMKIDWLEEDDCETTSAP